MNNNKMIRNINFPANSLAISKERPNSMPGNK